MGTAVEGRARQPSTGVARLVRRLEKERRQYTRPSAEDAELPTAIAWRAGIAEGLRLAQQAIRKGV
jgi:hypothetical protein